MQPRRASAPCDFRYHLLACNRDVRRLSPAADQCHDAGLAYLLLVLIIAIVWGFFEASLASIAATLTFNFFVFEPIGNFTIDKPAHDVGFWWTE
jgi:K+-sensing histidine kinase KdpD